MKKVVLLLVLTCLPVMSFARGKLSGIKSLKFGGKGVHTLAKVHVYVDKSEPAPQCGPGCVRYSVLVDDRDMKVGSTVIDRVVVLTEHMDGQGIQFESPVLRPDTPLVRMHDSPVKTRQVVVEVADDVSEEISDVDFTVLALKRHCLNPAAECQQVDVDVQGSFKGRDLQALKPASGQELIDEARKN